MSREDRDRTTLRVLYPINTDFPGFRANAIQVVNTAHAMVADGVVLYLLLRRASLKSADRVLDYYGLAPHPNLRIIQIPCLQLMRGGLWNKLSNLSFYPVCLLVSFYLAATDKVDVIYVRIITRRFYWFFRWLRDRFKKRLVFEAHEMLTLQLQKHDVPIPVDVARLNPEARQAYFQERDIYATADGVVFISAGMIEFGERYFEMRQPRCVVHDGTGFEPVDVPRLNDAKNVMYCGHLIKSKGVDLLIEAMAHTARDVRLTVVGGKKPGVTYPDYSNEREWLERRVAELGLGDRVAFTGYVPPSEIPGYLAQASILVMPMRDNPQTRFSSPLKVFEYMASGKPIVSSDLDGVVEILRHERNALLFRSDDALDLAKKLNRMLESPELQRRLAQQALEDVTQFSWRNRGHKINVFLTMVLGRDEKESRQPANSLRVS
jgi:glycosyltransferase involved in cell wall biosynthesis